MIIVMAGTRNFRYVVFGVMGYWFGVKVGNSCRLQVAGCGLRVKKRYKVQGTGYRVQGTGCRVQGAGCRVQGEKKAAGCRLRAAGKGKKGVGRKT